MKVLVAGASGLVGQRLLPLLIARGHEVSGLARSAAAADAVESLGARPLMADVFDAAALHAAFVAARPEVVVHQLTALPDSLDRLAEALPANARIRVEGTRHLVEAALATGARRMVAQSIAWAYAPGPLPHHENDPLDLARRRSAVARMRVRRAGGAHAGQGAGDGALPDARHDRGPCRLRSQDSRGPLGISASRALRNRPWR